MIQKTYYDREKQKIPIKSWVTGLEDGTLKQAETLSKLPFSFRHIALMPDAHLGKGMPIGGVIATDGVVIPNAVGKDIGCGMIAVKTNLKVVEFKTEDLKKIMGKIREAIPVGLGNIHKEPQKGMPPTSEKLGEILSDYHKENYPISSNSYKNAELSLGTLGSGNHFIEIQKGDDGFIWIMIHSGSRNLGSKVADYYNKLAQELCKKWYSNIPKCKGEDGLAFLPISSKEGKAYLIEMNYCLKFAQANRDLMMKRCKEAFNEVLSNKVTFAEPINIHHNFAKMEHHFGKNVMIHRKGATSAKVGQLGIIPGSQGTSSYIVEGLGNPESFQSCSHGAGRKMGRKVAIRTLDLKEEIKRLDDKGIVHGIRHVNDLDEASGSYKDIEEVMENQKDLVKIITKLSPLGVVKG